MPSIEIAVTCTWFQRRLCWMLSSLLQQTGRVPKIVFNIGYPKNNGNPTTEKVCAFFRKKGLDIREMPYDGMERIQYRGLVRNDQLQAATCDWILFADTDMTYHPTFFSHLSWHLKHRYSKEERILSARRVSLSKEYCKNYFNNEDEREYPCVVEKAGELEAWPIYQISHNCGAGYFQLVNREVALRKTKGLYVQPDRNFDWGWLKGKCMQGARSDLQFRSKMNGIKRIVTKPQYHLNHERDNEAGTHLEVQR